MKVGLDKCDKLSALYADLEGIMKKDVTVTLSKVQEVLKWIQVRFDKDMQHCIAFANFQTICKSV